MHLYQVLVTFPTPEVAGPIKKGTVRYRGIVGETEDDAIDKAMGRFARDQRFRKDAYFSVIETRPIVDPAQVAE